VSVSEHFLRNWELDWEEDSSRTEKLRNESQAHLCLLKRSSYRYRSTCKSRFPFAPLECEISSRWMTRTDVTDVNWSEGQFIIWPGNIHDKSDLRKFREFSLRSVNIHWLAKTLIFVVKWQRTIFLLQAILITCQLSTSLSITQFFLIFLLILSLLLCKRRDSTRLKTMARLVRTMDSDQPINRLRLWLAEVAFVFGSTL